MIWYNHRLTTVAITVAATGHLLPAILAYAGSTLPDAVEGHAYSSPSYRRNHRTWSHFWPIYFLILAASTYWLHFEFIPSLDLSTLLYMLRTDSTYIAKEWGAFALQWMSIGGLLHILGDMPCGGVPVWKPRQRVGKRLFTVRSTQEFYFALSVVLGALFLRFLLAGTFYYGL